MPIAANRAWVGFAKPGGASTYLTTATAAAATSIPVNGTVVPALSTIYFIDGANSESRAVTAGGGTSTLTVAATTNAHPVNCPIFWQLTASVGPALWTPVTMIDAADIILTIDDKGLRGSNVDSYGVTNANAHAEIGIDGDMIPDVFGFFLGGVYGAVDFAGGTPNTHTFAGMNTAASNGQPTGLLLFVYNGFNVRMYPGAKCSELMIKFDPKGNCTYTSKWMAFQSGVVAAATPSFSTLTPQAAWQAAASINSVTLPNVLTADFTIKRVTMEAVATLDGNQQVLVVWAGPLQTTGNMMLTLEDDSIISLFEAGTQIPIIFTLTNGTGATQVQLQLQMTKGLLVSGWKPTIPGSLGYVELGGPVTAVGNTTDANTAGGGYSPSRAVLKNTVATGTYQ